MMEDFEDYCEHNLVVKQGYNTDRPFYEATEQCKSTIYVAQFGVIQLLWGSLDKHSEHMGWSEQAL